MNYIISEIANISLNKKITCFLLFNPILFPSENSTAVFFTTSKQIIFVISIKWKDYYRKCIHLGLCMIFNNIKDSYVYWNPQVVDTNYIYKYLHLRDLSSAGFAGHRIDDWTKWTLKISSPHGHFNSRQSRLELLSFYIYIYLFQKRSSRECSTWDCHIWFWKRTHNNHSLWRMHLKNDVSTVALI